MKIQLKNLTAAMMATLIFPGCTHVEKLAIDTDNKIQTKMDRAKRDGAAVKDDDIPRGAFLGGRLIPKNDSKANLPAVFNNNIDAALGRVSLNGFAEYVSAARGISVRVMPDAMQNVPSGGGVAVSASSSGGSAVAGANSFVADYNGSLRGFLDLATSRTGTHWKYENSQIVLYRYITKSFVLPVLPGDVSITQMMTNTSNVGSIGSSGGAGAGGSSNTSGASIKAEMSPWKSIVESVLALVGGNGKVIPNQPTTSIVVVTTPEIMEQVNDFIKVQTARYAKQIFLEINFYSLLHTRDSEAAVDWNALFASLSGDTGLGLKSSGAASAGAGVITANIVRSKASIGVTLKALNSLGQASHLFTIPITASNAQFSQVSQEDLQEYISAIQTTQTANVGSSTSTTKGMLSTGLGVDLFPNLLDNDTVQLQLAFRLAESSPFEVVPTGGGQVSNANLRRRTFSQRAFLKNGEMLVLNGFERTLASNNSSGLLDKTILFGGSSRSSVLRESLIITVRPVIVEGAS